MASSIKAAGDKIGNGQSDARQIVDLCTTKWSGFMCQPKQYIEGVLS